MKASQSCIELIKQFEGLRLKAYKCVPTEEMWTIGYGHYGVTQDCVITQEEAERLLKEDFNTSSIFDGDNDVATKFAKSKSNKKLTKKQKGIHD